MKPTSQTIAATCKISRLADRPAQPRITLAVVQHDLLPVPDISNALIVSVIRGAKEAARDAGYLVIMAARDMTRRRGSLWRHALGREFNGLMFGHRWPFSRAPLQSRKRTAARIFNACETASTSASHASRTTMQLPARTQSSMCGLGRSLIGAITGAEISRNRLVGAISAKARSRLPR
ncbi:hypothetical protein U1707_05270 [Sphingomonas sp. PB2P12]|uniref:hypothetical protein n=1 Tax=Sphingomonas sandaracina TaxID=3096157 RepID=UPI002FC8BFB9